MANHPQAKEDNAPPTTNINVDMEEAPLEQETDTEEAPPDSVLSNSGMELGKATPDPETDLDDMEYDEDWMDFLKKITLPLDEITKATEDEEQDPEYNILADEEVDKVDKEELRMDKAVKISKYVFFVIIRGSLFSTYFRFCKELFESDETVID